MHIKKFLDEDYTSYAVYRVYQRMPHYLDTLGQTQRKILYALEQFPDSKKFKTAEVYSKVYDLTSYLHGDMSVYNVVENMARECSNNINLLTAEGSFGYRTNKSAAAPRYTSTRFSKASRLIFRCEDKPILVDQEFEGKTIEHEYMLPIIPVSLVNGYNAIAVGFASKFLPRHPLDLIEKMQEFLKLKLKKDFDWDTEVIPDIDIAYPYYSGNIIQDKDHTNESAWIFTGSLHKTKRRNIVEITDLPPETNREAYIKKLKKLQEKDIIKDFTESCVKNKFKFQVKVSPGIWKLSEDELLEKLGLIDKVTENLAFINPNAERDSNETIIRFKTSGEYLKFFIYYRQKAYERRKAYQLEQLQKEINILEERMQFIRDVNNGNIIIIKRKKIDIIQDLENSGFTKIDDNYDYLLGMSIQSLTLENVEKMQTHVLAKQSEKTKLEKTPVEKIHIQELEELKKEIMPELKKKELI